MPVTRMPGSAWAGKSFTLANGETGYILGVTQADPLGNIVGETAFQFAGATGGIINTSDVAINAAAGAGIRNYLNSIWFKNTSATASEIVVKDGATVIWRGHVGASMTFGEMITFCPPLRGTANTALNVALLTTATATIVSAQGYTGA